MNKLSLLNRLSLMNRLSLTIIACFVFCTHICAQEAEMEQNIFETMRDGDKAAVVAVHVGAEDAAARQSIERFNAMLRKVYPEREFRQAWTSRDLILQASSDGGSRIATPDELFSQLKKEGYTHLLIQSSNIVNGTDMQILRHEVDAAKGMFKHVRMGEPLLTDESDYEHAVRATVAAYGSAKEANVLVCNTTAGSENAQYALLDYTLKDQDFKDWFVGTTGGYPSLQSLLKQLKRQKVKKVHLIPFIFIASNKATATMTSEWTQQLQKAGYKVTAELRNLGDVDAIIDIFENHLRHAEMFHRYSPKELKMMSR